VVDACAGSGKSTTILSTAKEMPEKKILQFTYNAMLRHEVKEKTKEHDIRNILVHTYHSFAVNYYSDEAHTDTGIRHLIQNQAPPRITLPRIDILVLDEAQDMTPLYFQLIIKVLRDYGVNHRVQIMIMGDYMQGLYEFKGADTRFLTMADEIWKNSPYIQNSHQFKKASLKMSYRITNQMAKFVNRDMLGENRLVACREGQPVTYIRRQQWQIEKIVVYQITRLIAEGESPSDIFVLGGSVKGVNSNIRKMENALTENDIPCYVPLLETDTMDERVIDGKVVFSTFHSVKGRQRKYVFIVGFDNGYYYQARNMAKHSCPNTLYVGCTRATHGLYLLENEISRPLPFLKQTQPEMKQCDYIDFKGLPRTIFQEEKPDEERDSHGSIIVTIPTYYVTPTDIIKFIPESTLETITPILERIVVQETKPTPEMEIKVPKMVQSYTALFEDVSDINGVAIPAYIYDKQTKTTRAQDIVKNMVKMAVQEMPENKHRFLKRAVSQLPDKCVTIEDYLHLANVSIAVQEKLYSKIKQIREYTWITEEMMEKCTCQMMENLGPFQEETDGLEKQLIHHSQDIDHAPIDAALYPFFTYETRFRFSARVDLLTATHLWEFKCTSKITMDHILQLVIYTWLMRILDQDQYKFKESKILNVLTGERVALNATTEDLTAIVVELLRGKYEKSEPVDDTAFLEQCVYDKM
jgi:hypothetical protein